MNYNPLDRRPLSEAVKKHGSSKMFLWAIILSLAGAVLVPFVTVYEVYGLTLEDELLRELNLNTKETVITLIMAFVFAVAATVPSLLMNIGLLRGYRYFSGKTTDPTGFDLYLKTYRITLIVYAVVLGLYISPIITESFFSGEFFAMAIFALPMLAGICVGLVFLCYYHYKAIEKAMNCATCAAVDVNYGEINTFLTVMTVIGIVSSVSSVVQLPADITTSLTVDSSSIISALASVPSLIADIFFLALMLKFKGDMNAAKNEWDWIERQKLSIARAEAQRAAANTEAVTASEGGDASADGEAESAPASEAEKLQAAPKSECEKPNSSTEITDTSYAVSDRDVFVD